VNAPARHAVLPPTLAPRGLSRVEAAAYIGVSAGKFDEMVADGRMPGAISVDSRRIWDRRAVDLAFDALGGVPEGNEWDDVLKGRSG
jgi:hypothetical protein